MAGFIAVCLNRSCGTIYEDKNNITATGPGSGNTLMEGNLVGPCPKCGGLAEIPPGLYRYTDEIISLLSGPQFSVEILKSAKKILEATTVQSTIEETIEKVSSISPEIGNALSKAPTRYGLITWLGIAIGVLSLAIQIHLGYIYKNDETQKVEMYNEFLIQENKSLKQKLEATIKPKPSRNAPCPCGSGNKYKRCCGIITV